MDGLANSVVPCAIHAYLYILIRFYILCIELCVVCVCVCVIVLEITILTLYEIIVISLKSWKIKKVVAFFSFFFFSSFGVIGLGVGVSLLS